MTSLKTSIKTITYLSDTGCLEIQGASLINEMLACVGEISAISILSVTMSIFQSTNVGWMNSKIIVK
ncbi:hypothetical protein B6P94_27070 [Escherichia coli]|nr:hypothetical protein [Escherichia coli]